MSIDYGGLNKGWVSKRKKLAVSSKGEISNGSKAVEVVRKITVLDNTIKTRPTRPTEIIDFAPKNTNIFKEKSTQRKAYDKKTIGLRF